MLLVAAILSSIGGLAILAGAWIQAREAYRLHKNHHHVEIWVGPEDRTPHPRDEPPRTGKYVFVAVDGGHFEGGPLKFLPTLGTFFKEQTFAGWYGWTLVFVGGALVLLGSVIDAIAAA